MKRQKTRRRSLLLGDLEAKLSKYERRIQKIAEMAYEVRKIVDALRAVEENRRAEVIQEAQTIEGTKDGAA